MKKFISFGVALFLMSGCVSPDVKDFVKGDIAEEVKCDGSFSYDPNELSSYETDIQKAQGRFNKFVGRDVLNIQANVGKCKISTIDDITDDPLAVGQYTYRTGQIHLCLTKMKASSLNQDELFEAILMHEVGHSFGFLHISEDGDLMSVHVGMDFTDNDKQECKRVGLCTD